MNDLHILFFHQIGRSSWEKILRESAQILGKISPIMRAHAGEAFELVVGILFRHFFRCFSFFIFHFFISSFLHFSFFHFFIFFIFFFRQNSWRHPVVWGTRHRLQRGTPELRILQIQHGAGEGKGIAYKCRSDARTAEGWGHSSFCTSILC